MADAASELRRLCEHAGIESGYRDNWGRDNETSDETRAALLKAMGMIRRLDDATAALQEIEERNWRTGLPAVSVRRRDDRPYQWEYCYDEGLADRAVNWTLALENGNMLRGEIRPAELQRVCRRDGGATRRVKAIFRLHEPLPPGYHCFRLESPDAWDGPRMDLIIVPGRCYAPPEIAGGARVWGPALQLYAVRSARNWGIGDFTDLRHAIDLFGRAGASAIGLNPLHALFPHDPGHCSPYSPSSRNRLNPLYIDVEAIPEFAGCRAAREQVADPRFQAQLVALRSADLVDYRALVAAKFGVLLTVYRAFRENDAPARTPRAIAFERFLADGGEPLMKFALFHALQEEFHSRDPDVWGWPAWPDPYRSPEAPAVREYLDAHRDRVEFHAWLQWIADEQLAACRQYAVDLGLAVGLYHDLAVSIDRAGAEAWACQDLYGTVASVGSPPDNFNLYGQDWSLAPLIPERLTRSAYAPFIAMLRANMKYAGALRVDHVMGLTRLFWVPAGATPAEGAYVRYPFRDLLGILALESERNRCMVIGEDLGTMPEGYSEQLQAAGIYSYRILLFEKAADGSYRPPAAYPERAVAAVGTHDLPTLKGFWTGRDLDVRAHLNFYPSEATRAAQAADRARDRAWLLIALEREGLLPPGWSAHPGPVPEITPELASAIHAYIARSRAQLMMVQMEDVFGQIEQVNLPATGGQYPNWRRKLPLNLEEWAGDARIHALADLLRDAGRHGGQHGGSKRRHRGVCP